MQKPNYLRIQYNVVIDKTYVVGTERLGHFGPLCDESQLRIFYLAL